VTWRPRRSAALDDIVELLEGIGAILMKNSVQLETIISHVGGDDDEEADR